MARRYQIAEGDARSYARENGGVREWSKRAVLKTARVQALVGSNPTPSASTERAAVSLRRLSHYFVAKDEEETEWERFCCQVQ